ncbi:MAG: Tn3 family transposase [Gammaproteobacteria bacterium]|nr:Tn3 family transposase [Gammaproteobacteria bacterium]MCW5582416.1 Tn3 family transposase [Gammaproteobacteria bacterium]
MHKKANEKLKLLREQEEEKTKRLLGAFYDVLVVCKEDNSPDIMGNNILKTMSDHGGIGALYSECEQIVAYHSDNPFISLWDYFAPKRRTFLKLVRIFKFQTSSQNQSLINALNIMLSSDGELPNNIDISFAPKEWQKLIINENKNAKRYFEMAIFSCIANELRSGDIYINGAETFSDYRKELLDWNSCKPLIMEYCNEIGIPDNGNDFVKMLRNNLSLIANRVDKQYPTLAELEIDERGNPTLKKRSQIQRSSQAVWLSQEIRNRMPERNILDILCNTHHYAGWAHEFGPITGFDSKLNDPIERYILTNFTYGIRLGPTQAAKHIKANITAHMLSWVNRRHVTPSLLDKALTKLINYSNTFQILKAWGTGKSCAADG